MFKKRKEQTKMQEQVFITKTTALCSNPVELADIPEGLVFEVKKYGNSKWVMVFIEKKMFDRLEKACSKHTVPVDKVLYGTFINVLNRLEKNNKVS